MNLPHIKSPPETELDWFQALIDLARFLRTPEGCPWDREQTALDFGRYAQGEAEELVEALASTDDTHAAEELGDTLFTLLATVAAAEEEGRFTLRDALAQVHEKMIRRHDHVFGENKATTSEEAIENWNRVKKEEKQERAARRAAE